MPRRGTGSRALEPVDPDVGAARELEEVLLRLPKTALEFIRDRYWIRGHRTRNRIAARIADCVHRRRTFSEFADRLLAPRLLRALGRRELPR